MRHVAFLCAFLLALFTSAVWAGGDGDCKDYRDKSKCEQDKGHQYPTPKPKSTPRQHDKTPTTKPEETATPKLPTSTPVSSTPITTPTEPVARATPVTTPTVNQECILCGEADASTPTPASATATPVVAGITEIAPSPTPPQAISIQAQAAPAQVTPVELPKAGGFSFTDGLVALGLLGLFVFGSGWYVIRGRW